MQRPRAVRQAAEQSRKLAEDVAKQMQGQGDSLDLEELRRKAKEGDEAKPNGQHQDGPGTANGKDQDGDFAELGLTPLGEERDTDDPGAPKETGGDVATLRAQLDVLREELRRSEARYLALRGKYDTELGPLREELRQTKEKLQAAQAGKPVTGQPSAQVNEAVEEILKELEDEYPSSMVRGLQKAFTLQMQAALEQHSPQRDDSSIEELRSELQTLREEDKRIMLTNLLPTWEQIQQTREFQEHFAQEDPALGVVRNEVLLKHWQDGNIAKVHQMFRAFLAEMKQRRNGTHRRQDIDPDTAAGGPAPDSRPVRKVRRAELRAIEQRIRSAGVGAERKRLSELHQDMVRSIHEHGYAD